MFSQFPKLIIVALAAALLTACDDDSLRVVQTDLERHRIWLLDSEGVSLYHNRSGKLLQRIALPGWTYVDRQFGCPPDLALDRSGALFVTSNVLPILWRIDPLQFEVEVLELALDADRDKDLGFTALAFGQDGSLVAASAAHGSLWSIDVQARTAEKLGSSEVQRGVCSPAKPAMPQH